MIVGISGKKQCGKNTIGNILILIDIYKNSNRHFISLEDYVKQVRDYIDNGYEILGVYGIDQSPSCGINETCVSSEWYGEIDTADRKKIDSVSIIKEKGRFMEIFEKMLLEIGIKINFFNI